MDDLLVAQPKPSPPNRRWCWTWFWVVSWTLLNLAVLPEYVRLSPYSQALPRTVASILLPYSGLAIGSFALCRAVQLFFPTAAILARKACTEDWTFRSGLIGMAWGVAISQVSGIAVVYAASWMGNSRPRISSLLYGSTVWIFSQVFWGILANAASAFIAGVVRKRAAQR